MKKRKKKYKSVINQRIFRSTRKIGLVLGMLLLTLSLGETQGTNSSFVDTATSNGNTFVAGYWTPPAISITSPASGDEWQVGSTQNITWTATSADPTATAGMDVDIDYACDGDPWTNISTGTANDGVFAWTVPEDISNNCKIQITATDVHALTNSTESDQFEISWMVAMNEFLPNPSGDEAGPKPGGEWVELYNYGDESVDVAGWHLYDDLDHDLPITTSNTDTGGTTIAAHDWLVVYRDNDADFSLNNGGDTIKLYDDTIASGQEIDLFTYGATVEGKTWARVPDGTGPWIDPVPTPGKKNTDSNDLERFQKYYRQRCIKEDSSVNEKDPVCDVAFLIELGVVEDKTKINEIVAAETLPVVVEETPAVDAENPPVVDDEAAADPAENGPEISAPDDIAASDTDDLPVVPPIEPAVVDQPGDIPEEVIAAPGIDSKEEVAVEDKKAEPIKEEVAAENEKIEPAKEDKKAEDDKEVEKPQTEQVTEEAKVETVPGE